ncbi:MAG: NAD-dependent epimerase/dehydratase family protein [Methanomicrobiales archaeon]|nr:NAD-dependent epimerase/dehydratase family protein [Methanomicrobiales archaeon]MDI6875849.1 NAD-dependent epimerase/dehydratase family protein [Methanomicrobiales archaeon]
MFSVVTGGAGFIGSHLVDALVARGDSVLVIDSCCTGTIDNLREHLDAGRIRFLQADLLDDGWQSSLAAADRVYHLAADPDVRESALSPQSPVSNNVLATARVLEAMRIQGVPQLVFTSTSTVYGDATVIPTPEAYAPLEPVSVYGGTKLACEALISAYCHSFGMRAWVFRFANIIGERSNHGVCWDFIQKLRRNPAVLEILGDGRQTKSYLEVHACVDAMLYAADHAGDRFDVYNVGSEDWIDVTSIADIVAEEMGLSGVEYRYTGGARGWVGDVPRMLLSVEKLKALGWKPAVGSRESVRIAVSAMLGKRGA